ncbi:MAG: BtpA/SgcQ family protein [Candidatus Micrarchaeia archaeon]
MEGLSCCSLHCKDNWCGICKNTVFVGSVNTDFGTIIAEPEKVIAYRKSIDAEAIKISADIQVKHATMLKPMPIRELAKEAEQKGADAIIVTGKWTGNAPEPSKLKEAKESVSIPVLIGSGLDSNNCIELLKYADGAIVSTSLKEGTEVLGERNVKPYSYRISREKVFELMSIIKKHTARHKVCQIALMKASNHPR